MSLSVRDGRRSSSILLLGDGDVYVGASYYQFNKSFAKILLGITFGR